MKRKQHREHSPVEAKSEESARLAAQLTPLEEQARGEEKERQQAGAIVVDTARLKIPKGITDEERDDSSFFGFSPVVLFIFVLAIVFIGFITYLISIEPTQASGVGN